ncbi:MAG TPA: M14 family zinc carboxypeptidase [Gemmatimonadaceae bacterium]|nr:M14 family zinc carboxypeptidase [Gemmatimonadaceae bacterium]
MRLHPTPLAIVLSAFVLAQPARNLSAQAASPPERSVAPAIDISMAKPGRDPRQPIDDAYTKKIREYTTETFFLSPLVDYLPASKTVPTPMAVLGDIAGAPTKLPYAKEVYDYMRLLEKATPRVKVFSIGTTEEGREMIAVAIASDSLMKNLDANRANLAKLADPRTLKMDDAQAAQLVAGSTPVYYITGTIHSPESGAPTALMELAYRLAVDESPYVRNIRDHLITLITPVVEVDGRDRQVDIFNWHMKRPGETYPSLLYWGHYVAHDNNRDAMAMTLKLSQNVMNAYIGQKAQVLHDLHESVPYLYDNTIGDGPYNAWLDPLLTNEWQMIGWNNVQEMTRMGMPGVFAHGQFDTWSPGYLMFMAATHNGISRLYETFGNGGTAETVERALSPSETERTWWRQNPPLPRVRWSLRNNNNYEQTGLLVSLSYFANNRQLFLQNFWEKSKRSVQKARTEGPAAYVLPANDPRPGAQAELLRVMQLQHVEISRATAPFAVKVPSKQSSAKADSAAAAKVGEKTRTNAPETRTFPTGSYVIRMDQPYSRIADALLDYQYWSPDDPQKTPYDDTGWTFPEGFAVQAVRVTDPKVLDAAMERVNTDIRAPGGVVGTGRVFLVNHNGDNALATLRYRLKSADFQSAEDGFTAAGQKFARGSFVIGGVSAGDLDRAAKELGVRAYAVASAPNVKTHPARAARVAILHTWLGTQTEGWWRQAFDVNGIPYEYISTQEVAKDPSLNAKYDVILFPPAGGSGQAIIDGMPMWRNPMPWKVTPETPNLTSFAQTDDIRPGLGLQGLANLQRFVSNGGVLVGVENTADFAVRFGLVNGVTVNEAKRNAVVGSLLRSKLVDDASPIVYGVADNLALYSDDGTSFSVFSSRGGRGARFGTADSRATGRGTADDFDVAQGRPPIDSSHTLPITKKVQPWQAAPVTDDQLRNPVGVIPPDQRPRVALRFGDQKDLLVSGLLDGGSDIAQRPVVVDVPVQKGHIVLFANNPIWRGETIGSYFLVFNTILNWDNLNAGRNLDAK